MTHDTFQKLRQNVNQNDSKSRRQKCLGCICYPITRILKTLYKHNYHCISTLTEHTQQGSFKRSQIQKVKLAKSNTSARSCMEKFCFHNSGLILKPFTFITSPPSSSCQTAACKSKPSSSHKRTELATKLKETKRILHTFSGLL